MANGIKKGKDFYMKKLLVGLLGIIFCMPGYAASVVASVNGAPITDADVTARVSLMNKQGQTSTDNRRIALQNIIDDSVKIAYAQNFGAVPDDETVDTELKKITRRATKKDVEAYLKNLEDAKEALVTCRDIVARYDVDMQLTNCEFTLDKTKVINQKT